MTVSRKQTKLFLVLGSFLFVAALTFFPYTKADAEIWPMFGHDAQHTGQSTFAGPTNGNLKWHYQVFGSYEPVIGTDGTIYIMAEGKIHALNQNGTVKWIYDPAPDVIKNSPAIGPDGTIYAPGSDVPFQNGFLFAINPDGSLKWKFRYTGLYWQGLLTIGENGVIYTTASACMSQYEYYAINPNGSLKWTFYKGHGCTGSAAPAVGPDGTVYVSTGGLTAIDPKLGTAKWQSTISSFSSPAIANDGTIYLLSSNLLHAVNPNGSPKWTVSNVGSPNSWSVTPAIGIDGTIYITPDIAMNADGTVKRSGFPGQINSHIAISSNGILYSGDCVFAAHDAATGQLIWSFDPGSYYIDCFASPAIGSNSTVYFSGGTGLYAFGQDSPPSACNPPSFVYSSDNTFGLFASTVSRNGDKVDIDIRGTDIFPLTGGTINFYATIAESYDPSSVTEFSPNPDNFWGSAWAEKRLVAPGTHASFRATYCKAGIITFALDIANLRAISYTMASILMQGLGIPIEQIDKFVDVISNAKRFPSLNSAMIHMKNALDASSSKKALRESAAALRKIIRFVTDPKQVTSFQLELNKAGLEYLLPKAGLGHWSFLIKAMRGFNDIVVYSIQSGFNTKQMVIKVIAQ